MGSEQSLKPHHLVGFNERQLFLDIHLYRPLPKENLNFQDAEAENSLIMIS
jgi:hypothetical protein